MALNYKSIDYSENDFLIRLDSKYYNLQEYLNHSSSFSEIDFIPFGDFIDNITDGEHAGQTFVKEGVLFLKNSSIKDSIFCYWFLIYEEEISDKKIHPEGDIFLNKVLISELTKKKYYQSVFLEIENNKGHILETGTEINFIEILKYLKEESCEGCEELKDYFEKMQDYVLLAGIKINRKNKIL